MGLVRATSRLRGLGSVLPCRVAVPAPLLRVRVSAGPGRVGGGRSRRRRRAARASNGWRRYGAAGDPGAEVLQLFVSIIYMLAKMRVVYTCEMTK